MESAGPWLRNRLNPAEIQDSPKGWACAIPPFKACVAAWQSRAGTGAAEHEPPRDCGPFCAPSPSPSGAGTLLVPPLTRGERAAAVGGLPLSPGAQIYAG